MSPLRIILAFLLHPARAIRYVISRFLYPWVLRLDPAVVLEGRIEIREFPIIEIASGGRLVLGRGVKLNSRNEGYHVNMHSPVKLMVGQRGALLEIGSGTRIHGTCVHALERVRIGRNCLIAANTQIFDNSGHALSFPDVERRIGTTGTSKPVTIGDNVWIGANCIVLPGVEIGNGSVIAAGSIVVGSIPASVVAGGNPAIVLRSFAAAPS